MKNIILCADDYGQNTSISQAIIELIKKNRLSATSCMSNSYRWESHAKWLIPFKDQVDIGLHFNLTEGKPLTKNIQMMAISDLILKAYTKRLNKSWIEAELHAQIDRFIEGIGREPTFIDGHQHIQQLPIIRDALLNVYEKRLHAVGTYVRSVSDIKAVSRIAVSGYSKIVVIQFTGAQGFKKLLVKKQIPHNSSFAGFYDFKDAQRYPIFFAKFLQQIANGGIVMCHPAISLVEEDEIGKARLLEYDYFSSDQFIQDCERYDIKLIKFDELH